jgi:DNA polymerase-3 subunit beta
MLITLQQAKLARALSYVSKSVSAKPNIPVLSNVLLEVDKGTLKLSATNLDMGINMWIAGQVQMEGKVTLAARTFNDFIQESSDGKVTLELNDNVMTVKTDKSSAEFQTISADEFPILPKVAGEPVFTINSESFVKGLAKVIFACSTDNSPGKSQQTGVYFELSSEDNTLTLVGLDGYRLSEKKIKIKRNTASDFNAIIPARSLQELTKIIQSEPELDTVDVYVNQTKSQALFKFNEIEFSIRLLEGPYPEYKKVLPQAPEYSCEISKSELEQGIRIINTFARSVLGNRTDFDVDPDSGQLTLRSTVTDLGKNETEVKVVNPTGDLLKAAYNLRYLSDMVAAIDGDKIKFETKSPLSGAVFLDMEDPDFFHLIMPLKRDN